MHFPDSIYTLLYSKKGNFVNSLFDYTVTWLYAGYLQVIGHWQKCCWAAPGHTHIALSTLWDSSFLAIDPNLAHPCPYGP